jgi:PAS domain-containing protein
MEALLRARDSALRTGGPAAVDVRLLRQDGSQRVLHGEATFERDSTGRAVALNGYFQDVTEQHEAAARLEAAVARLREAEQAASERSHLLEELLRAIPVPVFYKGTDLRFLGHNEALAASLGPSTGGIVGKTVFDVRPRELAERLDASDRAALARPGLAFEEEVEMPHPDGARHQWLSHKAAFSDVAGSRRG